MEELLILMLEKIEKLQVRSPSHTTVSESQFYRQISPRLQKPQSHPFKFPKITPVFSNISSNQEGFIRNKFFSGTLPVEVKKKWIFINGTSTHLMGSNHQPDVYVIEPKVSQTLSNVVMLGEIKPSNGISEFSNSEKAQAISYCQEFLTIFPYRDFVYCFLTDLNRFQFFKVSRTANNDFDYFEYLLETGLQGEQLFRSYLTQDSKELGFFQLPNGMEIGEYLGKGFTSKVFQVTKENDSDLVFKHSFFKNELEREIEILRDLKSKNIQQVLEVIDVSTNYIIMKPVCNPLVHFQTKYLEPLINTLQSIHKYYIHRDIRSENIMTNGGTIYIIDFGFAVSLNTMANYSGTLRTASNRILELLVQEKNKPFICEPSDDLESFVKVIFLLENPNKSKILKNLELYQDILDFWTQTNFDKSWIQSFEAARNVQYDALKQLMLKHKITNRTI